MAVGCEQGMTAETPIVRHAARVVSLEGDHRVLLVGLSPGGAVLPREELVAVLRW